MAIIHGKGSSVLVAQYDLSAYLNSYETQRTAAPADVTCFGASYDSSIIGLMGGNVSLAGFFDGATGAIDDVLNTALGASSPKVVSLIPAGSGGTIGDRASLFTANETTYGLSSSVSEAVGITAEFKPTSSIGGGVLLAPLTARTGTVNLTSVDNSASSTGGYRANIHVTAFSGTSVVIKVQHSTDNSSWSDLVTFTSITAATSESSAATGTVNRYVRAIVASGTFTSVTACVTFARL